MRLRVVIQHPLFALQLDRIRILFQLREVGLVPGISCCKRVSSLNGVG